MDYCILDEEDTDTKNAQIMLKGEKNEDVFQSWKLFSLELETPSWRTRKNYCTGYHISHFFIEFFYILSVDLGSGGSGSGSGLKKKPDPSTQHL
jgi:hypothetical protein